MRPGKGRGLRGEPGGRVFQAGSTAGDKSPVARQGGSCMRKQDQGARARIRQKIKQAGIWYGTPGGPVLSVEFIVLVAKGIYFKAFAEVE